MRLRNGLVYSNSGAAKRRQTTTPLKRNRRAAKTTVVRSFRSPSVDDRAHAFVARLAEAMERYQTEEPEAYGELLASRSMDTDDLVVKLLEREGLCNAVFESNVLMLTRWVWTTAMEALPRDATGRLRAFATVMRDLNDGNQAERKAILGEVSRLKGAYLRETEDGGPPPNPCSVLTCHREGGRGLLMNSLRYCRRHWGLALLNGLRHSPMVNRQSFCDSCLLNRPPRWSLCVCVSSTRSVTVECTRVARDDERRVARAYGERDAVHPHAGSRQRHAERES